jgi:hypothetical protein
MMGNRSSEVLTSEVAPVTLPGPDYPYGGSAAKVSVSKSTVFVLLSEGTFVPLGFCGIWCLMNTTSEVLPNPANPNSVALGIAGESLVDISVFHDEEQRNVEPYTSHSIFCTASGKVFTAGFANSESLLVYNAPDTFVPIEVPSLGYCKKVFASRYASTVLTSSGRVWSAGSGENSGAGFDNVVPTGITFALDIFPLFSEFSDSSIIAYSRTRFLKSRAILSPF